MFEIDTDMVRIIMARRKITQADIAKAYGCTKQSISLIMTGKIKKVRPSTAGMLAEALGVDVTDIVKL